MIRHIVFFKNANSALTPVLKGKLDEMCPKIKYLLHFETGVDIIGSERSFDLCLMVDFHNLDDLKAYTNDEIHIEVVKWIRENGFETKTIDYEKQS